MKNPQKSNNILIAATLPEIFLAFLNNTFKAFNF